MCTCSASKVVRTMDGKRKPTALFNVGVTRVRRHCKVGRGNSVHGVTPYTSIIHVRINLVKSQRIVFKPGTREADGIDVQQPEY